MGSDLFLICIGYCSSCGEGRIGLKVFGHVFRGSMSWQLPSDIGYSTLDLYFTECRNMHHSMEWIFWLRNWPCHCLQVIKDGYSTPLLSIQIFEIPKKFSNFSEGIVIFIYKNVHKSAAYSLNFLQTCQDLELEVKVYLLCIYLIEIVRKEKTPMITPK